MTVLDITEMKGHASSHLHRDEKHKSSRSEDGALRSRTEEERQRRRREWLIQQEQERRHEKLKKKMILEYEIRRAREKGLPVPKRRYSHSRSKSESPPSRHRRDPTPCSSKTSILSEKLEPSSGKMLLFKGPEGTQISVTELRKIKVDIHRNIPGKSAINELQRDIVNPEDVVVKRRAGEGSKPIFEREEIQRAVSKVEEVEEHRTVISVNNGNLENKSKTCKRRSISLSPTRTQSRSPRRTSSRHSRHEDHKHDGRETYRSSRDRGRSRDRSRERKDSHKEKDKRRIQSYNVEEDNFRERRSRRDNSRSRERDQRKWDRGSHHRDERSYREHRGRSRERSRDRRTDRSRERRIPPTHYIEPVPVPIYYGVPLGSSRHPFMMTPMRPFPPRFGPPDIYRLRPPPNPRFGPMF
ncbi:uncharacterized protein LOC143178349 isoform X2 [Calliopsis andreniformis]|uniref:uncharacterized protein LOC143178349 isoform X2 n=1 Tax=Calliopsis andreniformis TaxID=337506 RepID=UPI003FCD4782